MKIKIISIGKLKNKNLILEIENLKKRIQRLQIIELKEIKENDIEILKKKEFQSISSILNRDDFNILLWEFGKEFSTKELYETLKNKIRTITFVITGPFGPSKELKKKFDLILSLSKMTFTHEQAYYLLIEQIYRINCIEKKIPYNK